MACSNFIPLPLLSYDWDLDEELFTKPLIYEEMFYSFEKFKAILSFKISHNRNNGPIGCTSLTNAAFLKSFEKHSSNLTNFNSIEI
jgi:hypothetical protein